MQFIPSLAHECCICPTSDLKFSQHQKNQVACGLGYDTIQSQRQVSRLRPQSTVRCPNTITCLEQAVKFVLYLSHLLLLHVC
jgi:hypothetical protein